MKHKGAWSFSTAPRATLTLQVAAVWKSSPTWQTAPKPGNSVSCFFHESWIWIRVFHQRNSCHQTCNSCCWHEQLQQTWPERPKPASPHSLPFLRELASNYAGSSQQPCAEQASSVIWRAPSKKVPGHFFGYPIHFPCSQAAHSKCPASIPANLQ